MERRWERVQIGGTQVYPWLSHVDAWKKPSQYCNYPPIKIIIKKSQIGPHSENMGLGDFLGGSMAQKPCSQCRGPGLLPGQGTRSHVPQLSSCAATKTQHSEINIYRF